MEKSIEAKLKRANLSCLGFAVLLFLVLQGTGLKAFAAQATISFFFLVAIIIEMRASFLLFKRENAPVIITASVTSTAGGLTFAMVALLITKLFSVSENWISLNPLMGNYLYEAFCFILFWFPMWVFSLKFFRVIFERDEQKVGAAFFKQSAFSSIVLIGLVLITS